MMSSSSVPGLPGVNAVNPYQAAAQATSVKPAEEKQVEQEAIKPVAEEQAAVVELSSDYARKSSAVNSDKVNSMIAESQQKVYQFQQMLAGMLGGQAKSYDIARWSADTLKLAFEKATPEQVKQAKEAISDGGYYSVDAVTDRIMDMAKALSGGDDSKIGVLKNAVEKGFKQAAGIYGKELPEISQKTYDKIMERFDKWENGSAKTEPAEEIKD